MTPHSLVFRALWNVWLCVPKKWRLKLYGKLAEQGEWGPGSISSLPNGLILKRKRTINPELEVASTRFVSQNTTIPVPRIFDVIQDCTACAGKHSHSCGGIIVMERIEGQTLQEWIAERIGWPEEYERTVQLLFDGKIDVETMLAMMRSTEPTMDWSGKEGLFDDLRRAFQELRSLTPPQPQAVANVSGGPLISVRQGNRELMGPFASVQDFHRYLLGLASFPSRRARIMKLAEPVLKKQHRICFTHADLHGSNILVWNNRLAGIIDWEHAGWYPEYFECSQIHRQQGPANKPSQTFWKEVGSFNGQYADELLLEKALDASTGDRAIHGVPGFWLDEPLES